MNCNDIQTTIMDASEYFGCKDEPDVEEGGRKVAMLQDLQRFHCVKVETVQDDLQLSDIASDGVEAAPKLFVIHLELIVTLASDEGAGGKIKQLDELLITQTGGDVEHEGFG